LGGWQLLDVGGRVVRRHELTDQAWAQVAPLLPPTGRPGGQWADHRRTVNGILWKLSTGVPWRDLPERYGPWQTCSERFRRWQADGTWQRLLAHAQTKLHLACDGRGRPLGMLITAGQRTRAPSWNRSWTPSESPAPAGQGGRVSARRI
jgi:hypothetical protein